MPACLDDNMEDRRLPVDDIADYVGVAKDTVFTWVTARACQGTRLRDFGRVKDDVEDWVRAGGAVSGMDETGKPGTANG